MVRDMSLTLNKGFALLAIAAAALVIGCGGGGGGGGGNGSTSTATTSTATTSTSTSTTSTATASTDGTGITQGVFGQVLDSVGNPLQGATVKFFNSSGSQVGSGSSNSKGNFAVQLPTNAVNFTLDKSSMANAGNYFNQFTFKGDDYLANDKACLASAPHFTSGHKVAMPTALVLTPTWLGPPPPPSGCLTGG
jgi:hypothetical protein